MAKRKRLRGRRRGRARKLFQGGLYWEAAVRAAKEALENRLIDKYWELFQEVYERHNVRRAEAEIWRAIADAFSPERVAAHGRRRRARSSRRKTASRR